MRKTEIETKLKLTPADEQALRQSLSDNGFVKVQDRTLEQTEFYDSDGRRLKRKRCFLRVRTSGDNVTVTFKGEPVTYGAMKKREEIELDVDDVNTLRALLNALGYYRGNRYAMYRELHTITDISGQPVIVTIDMAVDGYMRFCEIEASTEVMVSYWIQKLGLINTQIEDRSYAEIFLGPEY